MIHIWNAISVRCLRCPKVGRKPVPKIGLRTCFERTTALLCMFKVLLRRDSIMDIITAPNVAYATATRPETAQNDQ